MPHGVTFVEAVLCDIEPFRLLFTEVYHQQHTPAGGAVCGQALSGLVPST